MSGRGGAASGVSSGRLMLGASALTTLGAIPPFLLGSQAVLMMRELDFGAAGLGLAVSVFFAVAAAVTILLGSLIARWSGPGGLLVGGSLVAVGGLGVVWFVHGWPVLVGAMAVLGAANAVCQGVSNRTVATVLPPDRRGLGFGLKQSAVPAAIMLGGLAVPTTTAVFGWRSTFLVTGTIGVLVALAGLAPLVAGALRGRRAARAAEHPVTAARRGDGARHTSAPRDHAPWGPLLLCGVAIAFASSAANFLGAYLASWAHDVGLTIGQAGLLMAAGSGTSVLVRVATGFQADRRYGGNLSVVATMILIGAGCLALIGALPSPWAVVVFGYLGFALGWSWPGLMLYAVARVGRDAPTEASSVVQAGAFVGGALGPVSLGLVISTVGFRTTWYAAAACFLTAGLLTLLARRGFRKDLIARPPAEPLGFGGGRREPRYTTPLPE
ncbi:MFS transporter [Ornithinimicrobium tianjinense]|uniref:Major facilitator superfamily (MFS) profile domain-containing protein n=1 Tax=Ornithinimicrobium tianjinense TaxID=1195761 RepID=A0A917BG85_9MICO|nr:MFS transporter [Ornithinimicrobium tianjinense]GGF39459.1 hypothetical protein GCM10011366_03870 [Ornithinimicrobium tianjinense]